MGGAYIVNLVMGSLLHFLLPSDKPAFVVYTNWKKRTSVRHIRPVEVKYTVTEFHSDEQWILFCEDLDEDSSVKGFAMADIHGVYPTREQAQIALEAL